ncbi:DUF6311 domain-containing protein [Marinobacterium weihaiense]|uniref:4-amino-4-deoxy-L-arabinose transferase n=1 Tax=Marinobacterium weihaiense TaxID=2851016 RepID=A0ABS6M8S5_9GAMM|nr:DUF6311 domain-containing protein [Marinobacterium weihaiense]MBV0932291.1 hypothetical protein [Marinobacterium weihaiense]
MFKHPPLYKIDIKPVFFSFGVGLVALLFAVWLYTPFLNPLDVGWLLNEGDVFQHYIGWQFFRHEPWQWPLGAINRLATDMHASIVYTDSIPLVALLLKPFSTVLPDPFQYQGIWMLVTFFLNGFFAARLLLKAGCAASLAMPVALLMSTSTLVTARGLGMHGHEALTAHWVIFLALEYALLLDAFDRHHLRRWLILLSITVLIHFYLFFMVGVLWFAWWLVHALQEVRPQGKHLIRPSTLLLHLCVPPVIVLIIMQGAGYFMPGRGAATAGGFGHFSAELLTFFNPASTAWFFNHGFTSLSQWLPGWTPPIAGQYEGMAYMGVGVLLLWALALASVLRPGMRGLERRISAGFAAVALAVMVLFMYAMAGRISMPDGSLYLAFDLPFGPIRDYLRSSGRMVWPLAYALTLWAAVTLAQRLPHKTGLGALGTVLLVLQLFDLQPWHERIRSEVQQRAAAAQASLFTALHDPQLSTQLEQHSGMIAFPAGQLEQLKPYVWLAAHQHVSINVAYLAGQAPNRGRVVTRRYVEQAQQGTLAPEYIYLITEPSLVPSVCDRPGWLCRRHGQTTLAWTRKHRVDLNEY